jgi:hypothetical protein
MSDFRVLVLVLASDTDPLYCKLQSLWKTANHPRADILFLKAHPNLRGDDFVHENTIYIGCPETLEDVYEKQMRAYTLLLPCLKEYAFVFRTNLSSHLDIPMYLAYCSTLPRTKVYRGVIGMHCETPFASGCGYTITPDLIQRLVQENPPEVFLDDVSIGCAIANWGISAVPASREDYAPSGWIRHIATTAEPLFHRRVKTDNREDDVRVLTRLFKDSQSIVIHKPLTYTPFWMLKQKLGDRRP